MFLLFILQLWHFFVKPGMVYLGYFHHHEHAACYFFGFDFLVALNISGFSKIYWKADCALLKENVKDYLQLLVCHSRFCKFTMSNTKLINFPKSNISSVFLSNILTNQKTGVHFTVYFPFSSHIWSVKTFFHFNFLNVT